MPRTTFCFLSHLYSFQESDSSRCSEEPTDDDSDVPRKVKVNVFVSGTNNKPKQKFDKRDICLYCRKSVLSTSLRDHVTKKHTSEELVNDLLELPNGNAKRRKLMQLIRNRGNFEHNKMVLQNGGFLIVSQRSTKTRNISDNIDLYVACSHCYGFYHRDEIYRHKCPALESTANIHKLLPSLMVAKTSRDVDLTAFFNRMHPDLITKTAQTDDTINDFVIQQVDATGLRSFNTIANKVRLLSEFLIECRKIQQKQLSLAEALKSENFGFIREAVKTMFKYNVRSEGKDLKVTLERSSSAIRLKQTLDKIAILLHVAAIKNGDWESCKKLEYLPILLNHYLNPICNNARKNMKCSSSGLPQTLPANEAITNLVTYLDEQLKSTPLVLENRRILSEVVLARILIFNKRRSGEVAKMTKKQWESRNQWKTDILKDAEALDATEKILVKEFDLLYVNGKGQRYVPIIIPPIVTNPLKWLSETSHNQFVFCNQTEGHIRGHDALRNSAKSAGIETNVITSTKFRKLSATTLQVSHGVLIICIINNFQECSSIIVCI